jgi:hypothetical protein
MEFSAHHIGKKVFVIKPFVQDSCRFEKGQYGIIRKVTHNDNINCIGVEWSFESDAFHTCGYTCERNRGYYIYNYNFEALGLTDKLGNIGIDWRYAS